MPTVHPSVTSFSTFSRFYPVLRRWRQTRFLAGWVRLSHGWRTRCPTRSVRWLTRWRHPHPCRPLPPLPPHRFLRPPCHHPRPLSSAQMMWNCSLSLRSRIGKPARLWSFCGASMEYLIIRLNNTTFNSHQVWVLIFITYWHTFRLWVRLPFTTWLHTDTCFSCCL